METVVLTRQEFDKMPNYSHSLPSGTYLGKTWRRETDDGWYMGEYVPDPNAKIGRDGQPETVGIRWRKIEMEDPNAPANTKPVTP
jgi:hypothetical protein